MTVCIVRVDGDSKNGKHEQCRFTVCFDRVQSK